jgi:hypothetical protein
MSAKTNTSLGLSCFSCQHEFLHVTCPGCGVEYTGRMQIYLAVERTERKNPCQKKASSLKDAKENSPSTNVPSASAHTPVTLSTGRSVARRASKRGSGH